MTALSSATNRHYGAPAGATLTFPVKATTQIWTGSAVCREAAVAGIIPCATGLTAPYFCGFSEDSKLGGAATGDVTCDVIESGFIFLTAIAGATTDAEGGSLVYLLDDGSGFTLTLTGAVLVGHLVMKTTDGLYLVQFYPGHA